LLHIPEQHWLKQAENPLEGVAAAASPLLMIVDRSSREDELGFLERNSAPATITNFRCKIAFLRMLQQYRFASLL
jgi:hypothetical protein